MNFLQYFQRYISSRIEFKGTYQQTLSLKLSPLGTCLTEATSGTVGTVTQSLPPKDSLVEKSQGKFKAFVQEEARKKHSQLQNESQENFMNRDNQIFSNYYQSQLLLKYFPFSMTSDYIKITENNFKSQYPDNAHSSYSDNSSNLFNDSLNNNRDYSGGLGISLAPADISLSSSENITRDNVDISLSSSDNITRDNVSRLTLAQTRTLLPLIDLSKQETKQIMNFFETISQDFALNQLKTGEFVHEFIEKYQISQKLTIIQLYQLCFSTISHLNTNFKCLESYLEIESLVINNFISVFNRIITCLKSENLNQDFDYLLFPLFAAYYIILERRNNRLVNHVSLFTFLDQTRTFLQTKQKHKFGLKQESISNSVMNRVLFILLFKNIGKDWFIPKTRANIGTWIQFLEMKRQRKQGSAVAGDEPLGIEWYAEYTRWYKCGIPEYVSIVKHAKSTQHGKKMTKNHGKIEAAVLNMLNNSKKPVFYLNDFGGVLHHFQKHKQVKTHTSGAYCHGQFLELVHLFMNDRSCTFIIPDRKVITWFKNGLPAHMNRLDSMKLLDALYSRFEPQVAPLQELVGFIQKGPCDSDAVVCFNELLKIYKNRIGIEQRSKIVEWAICQGKGDEFTVQVVEAMRRGNERFVRNKSKEKYAEYTELVLQDDWEALLGGVSFKG